MLDSLAGQIMKWRPWMNHLCCSCYVFLSSTASICASLCVITSCAQNCFDFSEKRQRPKQLRISALLTENRKITETTRQISCFFCVTSQRTTACFREKRSEEKRAAYQTARWMLTFLLPCWGAETRMEELPESWVRLLPLLQLWAQLHLLSGCWCLSPAQSVIQTITRRFYFNPNILTPPIPKKIKICEPSG